MSRTCPPASIRVERDTLGPTRREGHIHGGATPERRYAGTLFLSQDHCQANFRASNHLFIHKAMQATPVPGGLSRQIIAFQSGMLSSRSNRLLHGKEGRGAWHGDMVQNPFPSPSGRPFRDPTKLESLDFPEGSPGIVIRYDRTRDNSACYWTMQLFHFAASHQRWPRNNC